MARQEAWSGGHFKWIAEVDGEMAAEKDSIHGRMKFEVKGETVRHLALAIDQWVNEHPRKIQIFDVKASLVYIGPEEVAT